MPTIVNGVRSPYGLKALPTFTPYISASLRRIAISPGFVGQRPTRSTWSQAPGTDTSRGVAGMPGLPGRTTWGSVCHTIAWPWS